MTPLFSLLLIAVIIGLLLVLTLVDRGRRGQALQQLASQLDLRYRPYASLSTLIRDAHFLLLDAGQLRHFRHLLECKDGDYGYINLFDYSLITASGVSTQTLLLCACPLDGMSRFCLSRHVWLDQDAFSESLQHPLQPLPRHQRPPRLQHWQLLSEHPSSLWQLLQPDVCDWIVAHPHLHIEWSDGILLLCRPQYLMPPEQISTALEHARQLIALLQQHRPGH